MTYFFVYRKNIVITFKHVCYISGDGGDSGTLTVLVARVDGNVELRSCKGSGAQPGTNGRGGQGTLSGAHH